MSLHSSAIRRACRGPWSVVLVACATGIPPSRPIYAIDTTAEQAVSHDISVNTADANALLNLRASNVVTVQFFPTAGTPTRVAVPMDGELRTLELVSESVRASDS